MKRRVLAGTIGERGNLKERRPDGLGRGAKRKSSVRDEQSFPDFQIRVCRRWAQGESVRTGYEGLGLRFGPRGSDRRPFKPQGLNVVSQEVVYLEVES